MEFRILGSFEVVGSAGPSTYAVPSGGSVACPVVHAGQTWGTNRLVEEPWPDGGTDGAARTVLTHVSQLRKRLRG
jgi:hypothetical protein